jgi:hypothetical protein
MVKNRAYIVPDAEVKGKRKTLVMRSAFGTSLALGMSPHVREAFQVEGEGNFSNSEQFYKAVENSVRGKMPWEMMDAVEKFAEHYGYTPIRLVPQRA